MEQPLEYVKSFWDLEVYKKQRVMSREVFRATKQFPMEERFSLTDQIRRSARSIGANIAEAWAKRRYPKHFVSKLTDADGEQLETIHWLIASRDADYLTLEESTSIRSKCEEIGRMLGSMIQKADTFTGNSDALHEDAPPYLAFDERATSVDESLPQF
jgi:four helix bundle protein